MTKLYLIISLFTILHTSNLVAQDGFFWGYSITFEFENIELNNKDTLVSVDFFVNQKSISTMCQGWEMENAKIGQYNLSYFCSTIGYKPMIIKCPDIYVKLEFKQSLNKDRVNYITRFIPFIFEPTKGPSQKIVIPKLDIRYLLKNSGSVVIVDAEGNYKVVDGESMENKPVMYNLVKFVEK
ncbi:hypothetical protein [Fluviicola taffensis]|uniref:Uncharacterized protein n=1 Tax=Fluviicola taffensis (strain DSM 16823 / NCIMB 13979 / RW262) TaxID=755732 RepID=F2IBT1_FLUTR|nr:hypothetical protein [Fluviicola taffensis]AEA42159.1 hypothetical protein Fluta_0149 [Fluviicola taffensis DSM 16823]